MGLTAFQTWSPSNVYLADCGPSSGTEINASQDGEAHYGYHTWANDNPSSGSQENHAYVRAQVTVGGQVVPISVDEGDPYRRQVNNTTYELMIGPDGARHTLPFDFLISDLPRGEAMNYGTNVLEKRRQPLGNF